VSSSPVAPRIRGSSDRFSTWADTEESDLDILVDPTPETSIFDIGEIRYQLRTLLGVSVDVLTPRALHERLREQVLSEAQPI
jgi:predicted nucleotidyltransferase